MYDMIENRHYWGYRISTDYIDYFARELYNGRLRQGWGYDEGQNLKQMTVDEGASRNMRMLDVKKGDILLIPRLPEWDLVSIVEASADWNDGYRFEISNEYEDFGHIFPAKYIKSFNRHSSVVSGKVRSTLHNVGRFWNIDHFGEDIEKIISAEQDVALVSTNLADRFHKSIESVFKSNFSSSRFSQDLYDTMTSQFNAAEWETALEVGLKGLFPEPYFKVEHVGGSNEENHGSDLIIRIPSISSDYEYVIAIQVKDYDSGVSNDVLTQINKADKYFNNENQKLIDKIVIVTRANKDENEILVKNGDNVKVIFANELKQVLHLMAKKYLSKIQREL